MRQRKKRKNYSLGLQIALLLGLTSATLFWANSSFADENGFLVYGVKTDFPLNEEDPRFKDIYINMGSKQGIKVGSMLDVFRKLSTVDELNQKAFQTIAFKIATAKVIHVENRVAVARVIKMLPQQDVPIMVFPTVMVGDYVDVAHK